MLPILRVLMNGETVAGLGRAIVAEQRLGVQARRQLPTRCGRSRPATTGAGRAAGLKEGDVLTSPARAEPGKRLRALADPRRRRRPVTCRTAAGGRAGHRAAPAAAVRIYAASTAACSLLPTHPVCADRGDLRLHVRPGVDRQLRAVLPGILLRQGRDPRRQRHPPKALRSRPAHPDRLLRPARAPATSPAGWCRTRRACRTASRPCSARRIQEPIKAALAFGFALWFDWQLTLFIVLFGAADVRDHQEVRQEDAPRQPQGAAVARPPCSARSRRR